MVGEDSNANTGRMADARIKGTKLVVVDPVCNPAAAKADEWLPVRPGTDAAFALAVINVLLNELGIYDAKYLKKHTNSPYLISPDGHYLRDKATGKPVVWDPEDNKAKIYDDPGIKDFALEGNYKVNGTNGTPAFQLLKEQVKQYTCEKAAEITTIPADTIRRIAKEFGEAARIGSTIVIEGKELPHRPACVYWRKGANQHKHSMLTGMAIQLMNIVIGAMDVPGGMIAMNSRLLPGKVNNWSYGPQEGPDGLLVPEHFRKTGYPYPPREVKAPEGSVNILELFPVAAYSTPIWDLVVNDPEKFKLPYKPEVLIQGWTNLVMNTINPEQAAETLKKFFQISFAFEIDETVEFADVVFPDVHYLETLNPALEPSREIAWAKKSGSGLGYWSFQLRQPIVEPPPGVMTSFEVLLEIADRIGFLKDVYHMVNVLHRFKEPYKLELDKKYTWEKIVDTWAKSWFGPEHDLAWFKEHGYITFPQQVEEVYTTPFDKPRIPVYLEHYIKAGEDVKRVTDEIGIEGWDVSDYQPLPEWKPCPAYEENVPDYDLFPVNYRVPFHSMSQSTNNVWLNELGEYNPYAYYIMINRKIAKTRGIKDFDRIRLQTKEGYSVEGLVKVTDCVHPEVVGIAGAFGHWAKGLPTARGKGVHFNRLLPNTLERMDMLTSAVDCCVKVKVIKVNGEKK